jgi:hypothetical protein
MSEAQMLPLQTVVTELVGMLGRTLTAYVGSVTDTRDVKNWEQGGMEPSVDVQQRLRFAHELASDITSRFDRKTAQAWLQGKNPNLDNKAALKLIRESDLTKVRPAIMAAESIFLEK